MPPSPRRPSGQVRQSQVLTVHGPGALLDTLRQRFLILAYGGGRWEHPNDSWRLAGVLGTKGIPNRVDPWGPEFDHDWPTWRRMLPLYLDDLAP